MLPAANVIPRYVAQARRYLWERGRLDLASQEEITSLAEYLRYHEFRCAIEPHQRLQEKMITDWAILQSGSVDWSEAPQLLQETVLDIHRAIKKIAADFGYLDDWRPWPLILLGNR